jgi:hypothetical protein
MRVYEINGLARSGHHAMINWVIKNLCGSESSMDYKLTIMPNNLVYVNEANLNTEITLSYISEHTNFAKILMLSYENANINFSILNDNERYISPLSLNNPSLPKYVDNKRIVFVRDFYNNLASRIESNKKSEKKSLDGNVFQWDVRKNFISLWKSYAKYIIDNKCVHLKYEDWLQSKEMRNIFMINLIGQGEHFDNKVRGTNSSFSGNTDVLDRISQVEVPEDIKVMVNSDEELKYYIESLGYTYRKLV